LITSTPVVIATYGAGALLLIGGLGVVLLRSLEQVAMAFVGCLLMVAALAWLLSAPVLAVVQLGVAIVAAAGLLVVVPGLRPSPAPPQRGGENSGGENSSPTLLISGAIAAVAILVGMAAALLRATWRAFEPGTGTTSAEYLLGVVVAAVTVLIAAVGVLVLRQAPGRSAGPVEAPISRRGRDRR
jgi:NADH:ubiquinone oxidoreductase subunit 6 (subunit J)